MVATEEYSRLIRYRIANPLPEEVEGENHHIVPKCCGGKDLQDNLIKLTALEHLEAHRLLKDIYTTGFEHRDTFFAWRFLALTRDGVSDEERALARQKQAEYQRGKPSGMKGKRHKAETKQLMSESRKGKKHGPLSDEHRRKLSEAHKGKHPWNYGKTGIYSEDTRNRMGESSRRRKGIPTGIEPWNKGKHLSPEDRKKKSEAAKRRKKNKSDDN